MRRAVITITLVALVNLAVQGNTPRLLESLLLFVHLVRQVNIPPPLPLEQHQLPFVHLVRQVNIPPPLELLFVHLVRQVNIPPPLPQEQHQLPFAHLVRQVNQALGQVQSYVVFQALTLKQDGPHALVAWKENIPPLAQRVSIVPRAIILPHSLPQVFPRV